MFLTSCFKLQQLVETHSQAITVGFAVCLISHLPTLHFTCSFIAQLFNA